MQIRYYTGVAFSVLMQIPYHTVSHQATLNHLTRRGAHMLEHVCSLTALVMLHLSLFEYYLLLRWSFRIKTSNAYTILYQLRIRNVMLIQY